MKSVMRYLVLVSSTVRTYLLPCIDGEANGPQMSLLKENPVRYL